MSMIERPATAFSQDRPAKQKKPRVKDDAYLRWIRTLPCAVCFTRREIHAAHIRAPAPQYAKRGVGMAEKPDDAWTVPLCGQHHLFGEDAQHKGEELAFWKRHGIDPFILALSLHRVVGDAEAAEQIIKSARPA